MQKKIYTGIDVVKLISAICIVLLHAIETTAWYPYEVKFVVTYYAVPFFFITSGFFFYKGLKRSGDKKKYFLRYEKHLISLFIIWGGGNIRPNSNSDVRQTRFSDMEISGGLF